MVGGFSFGKIGVGILKELVDFFYNDVFNIDFVFVV